MLLSCAISADPVPVVRFQVQRFVVEGNNPLSATQTEEVLSDFLGEHEGLERLLAAADALEKSFAEEGYSFHRVVLPRQTLEEGIVKLEIVVFKIDDITITGNQHFSEQNILASLPPLESGKLPNTRQLARALELANRHPSKQLILNMKQGQIANVIDAEVKVKDEKPWALFAAVNNIGSEETGRLRTTVGAQHNNFLNADNSVTLSYTTSPGHYGDVKQYGLNYQIPLYVYAGSLSMFYSKSDVDTGNISGFDISGAGRFLGASYTQLLPRGDRYTHELRLGIQDRFFNNDAVFTLFNTNFGSDVRSRPISLDYLGEYKGENSQINFSLGIAGNLGSGRKNTDAAYTSARFGADEDWQAIRFGGSANYYLPKDWLLRFRLDGQWSDDILIPGEQFGLGGDYSIRGFEERATSADSGASGSLEIWAPPVQYLKGVRFLGFLDGGYKHLQKRQWWNLMMTFLQV